MMRILSYLLIFFVALLGVSFALLNHDAVSFHYYLGERTLPLSFLLVISLSIGGLLGLFVGFWLLVKLKIKNYRLQQQLKLIEKEVENLRAIPLQDRK